MKGFVNGKCNDNEYNFRELKQHWLNQQKLVKKLIWMQELSLAVPQMLRGGSTLGQREHVPGAP